MILKTYEIKGITTLDSFVKYVTYLIDFANLIYEQETLTENNYISLWKETNLFHKRISVSEIIPGTIKSELLKIKLPQTRKEFSLTGIIRFYFYKLLPQMDNSIDEKIERILRKNVKEFRDRLENILCIVKTKN